MGWSEGTVSECAQSNVRFLPHLSWNVVGSMVEKAKRGLSFFGLVQQVLRFVNFTCEVWGTTSIRVVGEHDLPVGVFNLCLQGRPISKARTKH